jgi:thiamine phosphate synthase YjbQ (UPF0047 family)
MQIITLETAKNIDFYNVTPFIKKILAKTSIKNGQILTFSRHITTALTINKYEKQLLEDLNIYLRKLAFDTDKYLHIIINCKSLQIFYLEHII